MKIRVNNRCSDISCPTVLRSSYCVSDNAVLNQGGFTTLRQMHQWFIVMFSHGLFIDAKNTSVICPSLKCFAKSKQQLLFVMLLTPPPSLPRRPSQRAPEHSRAATSCASVHAQEREGERDIHHARLNIYCLFKLGTRSMNEKKGKQNNRIVFCVCGGAEEVNINHSLLCRSPCRLSRYLLVHFMQMHH